MAEPLRVAHIVGKMVGGGVEASILNYHGHIDSSRVQFDFLIDSDSTYVPREELEASGGRIFEIPPYQQQLPYQHELIRLFEKEKWRIVHSHVNTMSVFSLRAAKVAGVPIRIAHCHATMGKGEGRRNALKLVLRCFANLYPTDRVACSRYAGEWLFGRKTPFDLLPNAIVIEHFRFSQEKRNNVRSSWGVGSDCCVIGHVGRMESTKNQGFLIDAFNVLHAEHPDAKLVLVGNGKMRGELEIKVRSLGLEGSVLFLGQVDAVSELYHGFDVFAFPSLYEGFGMALLEAQISGLQCVVSNRVSSESIVSDNCRILSLEAGHTAWAQSVADAYTVSLDRSTGVHWDNLARYDIAVAADRLTKYYLNLNARRDGR